MSDPTQVSIDTFGLQTLIFDAFDAYVELLTTALTPDVDVIEAATVGMAVGCDTWLVGCEDATQVGMYNLIDNPTAGWDDIGAHERTELFSIPSVLVVWTGDDTDDAGMKALRALARGYIQRVGVALRPAPHGNGDGMLNDTLNQGGNGTGWCGLDQVGNVKAIQTKQGPTLHVQTTLRCTARI